MDTFFELPSGRIINRRNIQGAFTEKAGKSAIRDTIVTLTDGERIHISGNYLGEIAQILAIIPALPGFLLLRFWEGDGDPFVEDNPIIAWRIHDNAADPITPDWGANDDTDECVIQYPDGRIVSPGDRSWPNRNDWLQAMNEEAAAKAIAPASAVPT